MKDRIKAIRESKGLSQKDFGAIIGVKQTTVAGYENGLRTPIDAVILTMCREFGINETWLRTGEGEMEERLSREEQIAAFVGRVFREKENSFKKRFISMLANLDATGWEQLEKTVEMFASVNAQPKKGEKKED